MDIDQGNSNYYNCRGFGYLARNCRNKGTEDRIREERRLKYGNRENRQRLIIKEGNKQNNSNLNGEWDLILLDWVSTISI